MLKKFKEAIKNRRTYYSITNEKVANDEDIQSMIEYVVKHTPSAFNSQTARVVLMLGKKHTKLWDITKDALREIVPADNFEQTESKIDSFAAGYGTILFFEDQEIVKKLQKQFSTYKDNFPIWSHESNAMNQFNIWTSLELMGYGASLQHYNELITDKVREEFDLSTDWKLIAQMPFGKPSEEPGEKDFSSIENRVLVLK